MKEMILVHFKSMQSRTQEVRPDGFRVCVCVCMFCLKRVGGSCNCCLQGVSAFSVEEVALKIPDKTMFVLYGILTSVQIRQRG